MVAGIWLSTNYGNCAAQIKTVLAMTPTVPDDESGGIDLCVVDKRGGE